MPIENTACFWDLEALRRVGWFDSKIGVEEVSAIARISQKHAKKCVTLIPGASGYLNIAKSREGRHKEVVDTKKARQESEAARVGVTLEWLNQQIVIVR